MLSNLLGMEPHFLRSRCVACVVGIFSSMKIKLSQLRSIIREALTSNRPYVTNDDDCEFSPFKTRVSPVASTIVNKRNDRCNICDSTLSKDGTCGECNEPYIIPFEDDDNFLDRDMDNDHEMYDSDPTDDDDEYFARQDAKERE